MRTLPLLLLLSLLLYSCEDVIEVDVPTESPRLVVDALIRIDTSMTTMPVIIKVSETSSFFEEPQPASVNDMVITKQTQIGEEPDDLFIQFIELEPGIYQPSDNEIDPDEIATALLSAPGTYLLTISYQDEIYIARTQYAPAVQIDSLAQGDGTLFEGDETEVVVSFTDQPDSDNFYVIDMDFDEFIVTEDQFYQGQPFSFSYFYEDELEPGTTVNVSLLGADREFYNYMAQLIEQSGQDFGPFETPAVTVRGNILNATDIDNRDQFDNVDNPDNFVLGYFALSQEFKASLTIE
ncbi:DUF4249 family protein [Croceiramulus getboli]|nr:DUF4249 family protein [Flavobacteriaceae bacterium YJPT1-3]